MPSGRGLTDGAMDAFLARPKNILAPHAPEGWWADPGCGSVLRSHGLTQLALHYCFFEHLPPSRWFDL